MQKLFTLAFMMVAVATVAPALIIDVPEIDPSMGVNAFALLSGALLVLRSRKK